MSTPSPGQLQGVQPQVSAGQAQVGAVGLVIRVLVNLPDGSPADLSGSTIVLTLRRPSGSGLTVPMIFVADNYADYVTVDGDLNEAGPWCGEVLVTGPAGSIRSSSFSLPVADSIMAVPPVVVQPVRVRPLWVRPVLPVVPMIRSSRHVVVRQRAVPPDLERNRRTPSSNRPATDDERRRSGVSAATVSPRGIRTSVWRVMRPRA